MITRTSGFPPRGRRPLNSKVKYQRPYLNQRKCMIKLYNSMSLIVNIMETENKLEINLKVAIRDGRGFSLPKNDAEIIARCWELCEWYEYFCGIEEVKPEKLNFFQDMDLGRFITNLEIWGNELKALRRRVNV